MPFRTDHSLRLQWTPLTVILAANVLLILVLQFGIGQNLFEPRSLATLTPLLGVMVIIGLAQAFVIGTGGIDLSLPSVVTLMGIVVLRETGGANELLPKAILVAAVICVLIGLVNGLLIEVVGLNALVTTLATGQIINGATVIYRAQGNQATKVPESLSSWAQANLFGVSFLFIIALMLVVVLVAITHRMIVGRRLILASASSRASHLLGIRHLSYRVSAWMVAAMIAGLAGVVLAGQIASPDMSLGAPYLLLSIVVVVLGGAVLTGGRVSPVATLLGATFIILLDHGLAVLGLSTGLRTLIQGVVLAVGLVGMGYLLRPRRTKASRNPDHGAARRAEQPVTANP